MVGVASRSVGGHDGWAMQKRRIYLGLVVLGFGVVVAGLVLVFIPSREPSYGGKRLSVWVEMYATPPRKSEADNAIRHIGTNALPYLLEWIRYEPGPRKLKLYGVANVLLQELNRGWVLRDDLEVRAGCALWAIHALGAEAEAAGFAELSRLLNAPNSYGGAIRAAEVLISFGRACAIASGISDD